MAYDFCYGLRVYHCQCQGGQHSSIFLEEGLVGGLVAAEMRQEKDGMYKKRGSERRCTVVQLFARFSIQFLLGEWN